MDNCNLILNNLNFSLILFDENLVLDYINLPAQELTGYSDRFVKNTDASGFFYNNRYIYEKIKEVVNTGEGFIDFECEFVNKSNNKRFVLLEISKISDENTFYIAVSLIDITRFREMDNNIKNEEKLQDLSRFIAEMSHEIRNPLGGVKAAASYLIKKFDEAKADLPENLKNLNKFLEIIGKETTRINNLMEDLLSLSKKHKIKVERVNVNKIINEVLILEQEILDGKNIVVVKEFDPSLPVIYGSVDALKQVFLNALKNAIEALSSTMNSEIKIVTKIDHTRNSPKFLEIEFIDNGCGIKKGDIKNLFIPFFTTKEKGSGLGLAISRKIIYEHNGFIKINSVKNKGTTISVYLPSNK